MKIEQMMSHFLSPQLDATVSDILTSNMTVGDRIKKMLREWTGNEFPEVEKTRHVFSFSNGIYDAKQRKFYPCSLDSIMISPAKLQRTRNGLVQHRRGQILCAAVPGAVLLARVSQKRRVAQDPSAKVHLDLELPLRGAPSVEFPVNLVDLAGFGTYM